MKNRLFYLLAFVLVIFAVGCEDEDPVIENPEEEITSVVLTLSPAGGGADVVLSFSDPDGEGGNAPVITTTPLTANTTYSGSINFSNDDEDVNEEIEAEDDEHQVFYVVSSGLGLTFTYGDQDGNGAPLGLLTNATTGAAGTGTLTVTLRHEPAKDPAAAIDNPAAAGGETDVEVTFDVTVQ